MQKIYVKTYARSGPYLIGIMIAFYFHKNKQIKKGLILKFFLWSFIFMQLTLPFYTSQLFNFIGKNVFLNAFTIGFIRIIWATAIAFLIVLCKDGDGGFVNKFLSHKFWTLLSKIGLSLYLIHPVAQYNSISSQKHLINLETVPMVKYMEI
jgi:peptidoglycan/LPS O-acetylase OafA/YrhL